MCAKIAIMNYLRDYDTERQLGFGSFGVVKLLKHRENNHQIACKQFINLKYLNSWRMEVSILDYIKHPNIILMYDCLEYLNSYYIFMELLDTDLEQLIYWRLDGNQRISRQNIMKISISIANALIYCHEKSILHRDVKPANIMVDFNFKRIKLIDFGISCMNYQCSQTETNLGTLNYRSPELLLKLKYGLEIDTWALGCVIAEMYMKKPLFYTKLNSSRGQIANMVAQIGPPILTDGIVYDKISYFYPCLMKQNNRKTFSFEDRTYTLPEEDKHLLKRIFKWNYKKRATLQEIVVYYKNFIH